MMTKNIGISEFHSFVKATAQNLPPKFVDEVSDVELGQWETSFEALLLELMKSSKAPNSVNFEVARELAVEANIIDEGVLDPNTWSKFCDWCGVG